MAVPDGDQGLGEPLRERSCWPPSRPSPGDYPLLLTSSPQRLHPLDPSRPDEGYTAPSRAPSPFSQSPPCLCHCLPDRRRRRPQAGSGSPQQTQGTPRTGAVSPLRLGVSEGRGHFFHVAGTSAPRCVTADATPLPSCPNQGPHSLAQGTMVLGVLVQELHDVQETLDIPMHGG